MPTESQTFYLNPFGRVGVISFAIFAPVFWIASDNVVFFLIVLALFVFAECLTFLLCTITVSSIGIVLFRVNRASWQDFTAVKRISSFGMPYLLVERRKGHRWRIPLYLAKLGGFHRALASHAPPGNPLREYADNNI